MMNEAPLIYTTRGNVPVESLRQEISWEDTPTYVKMTERYFDLNDGEVVKESAYVLSKVGLEMGTFVESV